jgi:hypothetical protein
MNYSIRKSTSVGWIAETMIPLGEGFEHSLKVSTSKTSRGVQAAAQCVKPAADGMGYSYIMFGDFSALVCRDSELRGTEKAIRLMHERALSDIEEVLKRARAFYLERQAKAA